MGLKLMIFVMSPGLNIGVIKLIFQILMKIPFENDYLKMRNRRSLNTDQRLKRKQPESPSGPTNLIRYYIARLNSISLRLILYEVKYSINIKFCISYVFNDNTSFTHMRGT